MFEKLKQIKNLREQAKRIQDELAAETVHHSWHDKIDMIMDGNQKIVAIDIKDEWLKETDRQEVQRALADCFNETVKKAQMAAARRMQASGGLGGLNFPGL